MIGLRKNERDGRFWVVDFYQFLLDVAQFLILTILFAYEIIFFNIPKTLSMVIFQSMELSAALCQRSMMEALISLMWPWPVSLRFYLNLEARSAVKKMTNHNVPDSKHFDLPFDYHNAK